MSEWKSVTLGEVALRVTVGHVGPMAHEYTANGVPFLRSQNILPHALDLTALKYISPEFNKSLRKSELRAGDVATVRTGAPGTTCVIPESLGVANCSDLVITRTGPNLDPYWLSYFLNNSVRGSIAMHLVGAVQQHFNVGSARSLKLLLPSLEEQRGIAEVLGALDDKIAANSDIGSIIPSLVDTKYRQISTNHCETEVLGNLVTVTKGVSYRRHELGPSDRALVSLKCVGRDGDFSNAGLKPFTGVGRSNQVVRPGELVVAQTDLTQAADVVGRAVMVPPGQPYRELVASLDVAIVRPNSDTSEEYLLGLMRDPRFREHCRSRTSGTTVLHLTRGAIETYQTPSVSKAAQGEYTQHVRPLLAFSHQLQIENERLAATRDALLPLLMSGKLRVKDAEKHVGELV